MSIQLLTQLAQAGDFAQFKTVFPTVPPCTDAEARTLINAVVAANPPEKTAIIGAVLALNQNVPAPNSYPADVQYVYRGCVLPPNVVKAEGFTASMSSTAILEHKRTTGASCYVSCSKLLDIAVEFAQSQKLKRNVPQGFVYKIEPRGGIDCVKWFFPLREFHEAEAEVVFHRHIPSSAVVAYAIDTAPTNFMPL